MTFAALLRKPRSPRTVVVWLALWLALVGNLALWRELIRIAPEAQSTTLLFPGVFVFVFFGLLACLALTAWGRAMKPLWIVILIAAGVAQHFMLSYGVVMDTAMLANTMQTDVHEVRDLLSPAFFANVLLVAGLPTLLLLIMPVRRTPWWTQVWQNAALCVAALAVTLLTTFAMFRQLAPMVRNHMQLRHIVNPVSGISSAAWVVFRPMFKRSGKLVPISAGAALGPAFAGQAKPPLLVIVVGETARADHFSLNGYPRDTNPELAARQVLSFHDVRSCGTDTRDSVPCMFSALGKRAFEDRKQDQENLLDLLQSVGLAVLWIDNQAGCKGVCARVPSASTDDLPKDVKARLCMDGECRDEALLVGLDARIARLDEARRRRGLVVVMHQMGSHGPAYFKRSAPEQKRFLPECTNTSLGNCDPARLINAYDNSILATDHFLASTIDWMKAQAGYAPTLLYMSDHGESLGEHGIFLHGLPYSIAPEVQKRVPFIAWLGDAAVQRRGVDLACLRGREDEPLSHDNLYHTALGVLGVTTPTYRRALDAFAPCERPR